MRIAVVGAGVVGSYFGGALDRGGEDVTFVARGATLRALREGGLRVDSVADSFIVNPVRVTNDPRSLGAVDVVILAVKGWQVPEAIETVSPLMGPGSFVAPFTDGIEAPDQLASAFGKSRVVGGLAVMLGSVIAPGHIRNTLEHPYVTIGELDGRHSERVLRLQQTFERARVRVNVVADILAARWEKLILVGPYGGVGALTRAPLGVIRSVPETRELLKETMCEVLAVGRARGMALSEDSVKNALATLDRGPARGIAAMQRDIMARRPSELETQIGAVVRLARSLAIDAPSHEYLYASLLPQERKARGEIEYADPEEQVSKAA